MARETRRWVSHKRGAIHIMSFVVGKEKLLKKKEREYFNSLLKRLASCFFLRVITTSVLSTHFHLLVEENEAGAQEASEEELMRRYQLGYGKGKKPPMGIRKKGRIVPDPDGGIQRLRNRLGSISVFVKELKEGFSRWYNEKNNRKGHFWGERYKGVIVYKGMDQLDISSYIDLNAVRAGLADVPEAYRWCSLGMRVREPKITEEWLQPLTVNDVLDGLHGDERVAFLRLTEGLKAIEWYRMCTYIAGGIECKGKGKINEQTVARMVACKGRMERGDILRYRNNNLTESLNFSSSIKVRVLDVPSKIPAPFASAPAPPGESSLRL